MLTKQEAIKARNQELAAEVSAMETKLEDARGKLKYAPPPKSPLTLVPR